LITSFGEQEFTDLQPNILVTIGGMVVSKRIKAFLRKYSPKEHWHVDLLRAYDTFGVLSDEIKLSAEDFFNQMPEATTPSDYQQKVVQLLEKRKDRHQRILANVPYSDWSVYAEIW